MNPGLEPILLNLEKLFLQPDEGNTRNYNEKLKLNKLDNLIIIIIHICFFYFILKMGDLFSVSCIASGRREAPPFSCRVKDLEPSSSLLLPGKV